MAQLNTVWRLLVAGTFISTLATADTVANKGSSVDSVLINHTSQSAAGENVAVETGAIGVLGSAAWLVGLKLRKKLIPPRN